MLYSSAAILFFHSLLWAGCIFHAVISPYQSQHRFLHGVGYTALFSTALHSIGCHTCLQYNSVSPPLLLLQSIDDPICRSLLRLLPWRFWFWFWELVWFWFGLLVLLLHVCSTVSSSEYSLLLLFLGDSGSGFGSWSGSGNGSGSVSDSMSPCIMNKDIFFCWCL